MPDVCSVATAARGLPGRDPAWLPSRHQINTGRVGGAGAGAGGDPEAEASNGTGQDAWASNKVGTKAVIGANADDPHVNADLPLSFWLGVQACGVDDVAAAKSLARNLLTSCLLGCLKLTRKDIEDTLKTPEKRIENDITVKPFTKTVVLAFHHWAKTGHWLESCPEMTPFPVEDADLILEKADEHEQFILDASDIKSTAKPGLFAEDDKWSNLAESLKECISLSPGSAGLPLSCEIHNEEQPQLLPHVADKENFISMLAKLKGKTFDADSEKALICLVPFVAKDRDMFSIVKGMGTNNVTKDLGCM